MWLLRVSANVWDSYQKYFVPPLTQWPPVDLGLLIIPNSRSLFATPQSVGLLWTSDQPDAETSTWQHTTVKRDRNAWPRRDSNPQSHQANRRSPTPWTARPLGSAFSNIETENTRTGTFRWLRILWDLKIVTLWPSESVTLCVALCQCGGYQSVTWWMESAALRWRPSVVRVCRDLIQLVHQQPTRCRKQESQILIFNDRTLYLKYPSIWLLQKV